MNLFYTMKEASIITKAWQKKYNEKRPHSALGGMTPQHLPVWPRHPPERTKPKKNPHSNWDIKWGLDRTVWQKTSGGLTERLAENKWGNLLICENFLVPFDNNQAERGVRMVKVKTKVSGCFRTKEGADSFATIMSYVGTANKQSINSFLAIKNALVGQSDFVFV